jgi:hypothetical protein
VRPGLPEHEVASLSTSTDVMDDRSPGSRAS